MLKTLVLENFQAHKKLDVELGPRVTCIVGPSDTGKSAIIRAIRWVLQNRPQGDAFIREGTKSALVGLRFGKHTIVRARGGATNSYTVDGEDLKAFGNDVPDQVQKLANIGEINFQGQHDSPFWFSETAGEVSRQLNQIVNLEIIDKTLAGLASTQRQVLAEKNVVEERLEDAKEEKEKLRFVRELLPEFDELDKLYKLTQEAERQRAALGAVVEELSKHAGRAESLAQAAVAAGELLDKRVAWDTAETERQQLDDLLRVLTVYRRKKDVPIPDLSELEALAKDKDTKEQERSQLSRLVQDARTAKEESWSKSEEAKEAEKKLKKEMGGTCQLCGAKIES
jgi:exonuclease SbcC